MRRLIASCRGFFVLAMASVVLPAAATQPEALPDLVVESVDASELLRECGASHASGVVVATVRNDGTSLAFASAHVLFFEDRDRSRDVQNRSLHATAEESLIAKYENPRVVLTDDAGRVVLMATSPI